MNNEKTYPIVIKYEDKYWIVEYINGKLISDTNMEIDQATAILFERIKSELDVLVKKSYQDGQEELLDIIKKFFNLTKKNDE